MRYNLFGSKQEVKEIIRFIPKLNKKKKYSVFHFTDSYLRMKRQNMRQTNRSKVLTREVLDGGMDFQESFRFEEEPIEVEEMLWRISAASVTRSPWHLFKRTTRFLLNNSFILHSRWCKNRKHKRTDRATW